MPELSRDIRESIQAAIRSDEQVWQQVPYDPDWAADELTVRVMAAEIVVGGDIYPIAELPKILANYQQWVRDLSAENKWAHGQIERLMERP